MIRNAGSPKGVWGKLMINAMNFEHASLSLWGLDNLPQKSYDTALDIGCGGGLNIMRLSGICSGKIYGIDVSPLCVKDATKRCKKLLKQKRAEITLGNASSLPYPSGGMDLVTAFETVYFWDKIDKCFAEIYRVLRNEGVFLVNNELKAEEKKPDKYEKLESILDLKIYGEEELTALLTEAGFADIKVYTKGEDWICVTAVKRDK